MLRATSKLVVTGCCSCTATYSISASNSAAPLMGQLRVIHCPRLAATEQPPDQLFVLGRFPVGGTDDFFHDHAVAIEYEALRHPGRLINFPDRAAPIVHDLERESHVLDELVDHGRVLFIDADCDQAKVGVRRELVLRPAPRAHFAL